MKTNKQTLWEPPQLLLEFGDVKMYHIGADIFVKCDNTNSECEYIELNSYEQIDELNMIKKKRNIFYYKYELLPVCYWHLYFFEPKRKINFI